MGKLKLKPGIKKTIKWILITLGILFALFCALITYFVIQDFEQEEILKQEIINYSNKNLATDNYDITVKTKGDYAYVEEAIKKYYKNLSDNIKTVNSYLNSEKLNSLLTVNNLVTDRPDYSLSKTAVKNCRLNINNGINKIKELCEEETIKNLLDKKKLDDPEYYYDFYLQLMYTDQDIKEFESLNKNMDILSQNINAFFDKIDEILLFLEKNDSTIEYKDNTIYFTNEDILKEYKNHLVQLDEVSRNITVEKNEDEETNSI